MRARLFVLSLVAGALACDALNGPATGVDYRGEPLAVVNGRMTADRNLTLIGDLRLAIAWFTSASIGSARPDELRTESVIYEPVFPAGFSVGLYDLPETKGTVEGPDDIAAAAIGMLIAYDDRNRNGVLDTFRGGERPVDHVLGASFGTIGADPNAGYFIVFVRDPGAPGTPSSLQRGLNLLRGDGAVVGFDTVVPLHLDGHPNYNLLLCEDYLRADSGSPACFESVFTSEDGGIIDAGTSVSARVSASIGYSSGQPAVDVTVYAGTTATMDASVTMNGISIPYDTALGRHSLFNAPGSVVPASDNALHVVVNGAPPLTLNVFLPGDFSISAPAFNAAVDAGEPVTVNWTASKDAGSYRVTVYRSQPFSTIHDQSDLSGLSYEVPPLGYQGNATLSVQAALPDINVNNNFVYRYTNRSVPIRYQ